MMWRLCHIVMKKVYLSEKNIGLMLFWQITIFANYRTMFYRHNTRQIDCLEQLASAFYKNRNDVNRCLAICDCDHFQYSHTDLTQLAVAKTQGGPGILRSRRHSRITVLKQLSEIFRFNVYLTASVFSVYWNQSFLPKSSNIKWHLFNRWHMCGGIPINIRQIYVQRSKGNLTNTGVTMLLYHRCWIFCWI